MNSQVTKCDGNDDASEPSDNERDESSLALFSLDFQSADVRRGFGEVNSGSCAKSEDVFDLATLSGMGEIRLPRWLQSYAADRFGLWLSLVERLPRVQEAAGSNPASPIAFDHLGLNQLDRSTVACYGRSCQKV